MFNMSETISDCIWYNQVENYFCILSVICSKYVLKTYFVLLLHIFFSYWDGYGGKENRSADQHQKMALEIWKDESQDGEVRKFIKSASDDDLKAFIRYYHYYIM